MQGAKSGRHRGPPSAADRSRSFCRSFGLPGRSGRVHQSIRGQVAVTSAVERTLDLLARSRDEAAADLLREAAGRVDDEFGLEAVLAIGRHGSMRQKNDVLRQVDDLSARQKDALRHKARAFADAAVHGLGSSEPGDRERAVAWIASVDDFERFEHLVKRLVGRADDRSRANNGDMAAAGEEAARIELACEQLVERMYDLTTGRDLLEDVGDGIRNARQLREQMAAALLEACDDLAECGCAERLLEWTLILLDPESAACAKLVQKLDDAGRATLHRTLMKGQHPGIMRLAWDLLKRGYPPPIAFDMWRQRRDTAFISHTLRTQPTAPTTAQIQNLEQIEFVPWLDGDAAALSERFADVPPALLPGVVAAMEVVSLPEEQQKTVLRWLLACGDGPTRQAASEMFELLGKAESHQIITDSLDHEDVEVQAWATAQLRPQDVPGAIRLLIERLDSPEEEIREAAREELHDFNFSRMAMLIDTEPQRVTPAMGRLICKIDPDTLEQARRELAHAIRGRRLKAIATISALGLAGDLIEGIAALLDDSDMLVRRTAVEALAVVPSRTAVVALERARHDESQRVREAAGEAMRTLRRALIAKARAEAAAQNAATTRSS